jgi:hypothetical protein
MCVEIDRNEWNRYCIMYINIYIYMIIYIYICDMPHEMRMECVLKFSKLCCMHGCIVLLLSAIAPCLFKFAKLPLSRPLRTYYEPTTNRTSENHTTNLIRPCYVLLTSDILVGWPGSDPAHGLKQNCTASLQATIWTRAMPKQQKLTQKAKLCER